jgi:hypothetical protein
MHVVARYCERASDLLVGYGRCRLAHLVRSPRAHPLVLHPKKFLVVSYLFSGYDVCFIL